MGLFTKKSQYQKDCEAKIEELCGGFFFNENYEKRVRKFNRTTQSIPHDRVKGVLKHECEDGKLALEDIETRLDELMQLDCNTLDLKIRMTNKQDTSIFKTQDDIVKYMGPEYEAEYSWKIEQRKIKTREKIIEKEGHFDFNDGVSVNLVTSEFGLKVNNSTGENIFQTTGIASEKDSERNLFLTTFMQVTDSKIIFQKALEDGGDLEITLIHELKHAEQWFDDTNLNNYQKHQAYCLYEVLAKLFVGQFLGRGAYFNISLTEALDKWFNKHYSNYKEKYDKQWPIGENEEGLKELPKSLGIAKKEEAKIIQILNKQVLM